MQSTTCYSLQRLDYQKRTDFSHLRSIRAEWCYFPRKLSLWNAGPVYLRNPDFVITVPADGLAPEGARSSAGTVVITKLHDNIT